MAASNSAEPIIFTIEHNPFFQTLLQKIRVNENLEKTRVLIELGKNNLDIVLPQFVAALSSDKSNLQWSALYELFEAGKMQAAQIFHIIHQAIQQNHPLAGIASTRVLIEIGKKNPLAVIEAFHAALNVNDTLTKWASIFEITELAKLHPDYFLPLLENALDQDDEHAQWLSALALMELAKIHPSKVQPLLKRLLQSDNTLFPLQTSCSLVNIDHSNPSTAFTMLKLALGSNNHELEWQAMLDLIELAKIYPDEAIPVIEQALECDNPHVQWLAMLELVELAKTYPEEVATIIQPLLVQNETPDNDSTRVLVELGKSSSLREVIPLLEQGIQSDDNPYLQWAALQELSALGQIDPQTVSMIMEKNLLSKINKKYKNTRILIELGANQPQQVLQLLKLALKHSDNTALQRAAFRELIELVKQNKLVMPLDNDFF